MCDHENYIQDVDGYYCPECCVMLNAPVFAKGFMEKLDLAQPRPQRFAKFRQALLTLNIEWWIFDTMIDLFEAVDRVFSESDRVNFISMNQLIICMLKRLGVDCHLVPLKTQSRRKIVEQMVDKAMEPTHKGRLPSLLELDYIEPKIDLKEFNRDARLQKCLPNQPFTCKD